MPCSAVRTSSASLYTAVSAPASPLHSARVEHNSSQLQAMYDPVQVALLNEECILVDENDKVVGTNSKKNCHLMTNINKGELGNICSDE